MGSRRRAREFALQALYNADVSGVTVVEALTGLWAGLLEGEGVDDQRPAETEEVEFAKRMALGVVSRKEEIDGLIEQCSTNWRLARMPVVDRNVLRIASYELLACDDIPPTVSINEAVELAKRFGTAESRAFVNGIVDRLARNAGRLPEK